jgi:transcriptional regulator with XRE-family HTH domain
LNPSKSTLWGPENEALLKSLRLSAGIDLGTLARRNIVSTTQVRQLEEGGDSSFYSSEIKFSVGKKLLKHLGHDLKVEVAVEQALITSLDMAQAETPSVAPSPSEKVSIAIAAAPLMPPSTENLAPQTATQNSSIVFPLFLSGVVLFVAMWIWLGNETSSPPEAAKNTPPALKSEATVDSTPVSLTEKSSASTNSDNVAVSLQTISTPKELAKPESQATCIWNNAEVEVQPDYPQKAGEYVHVVAQQASTVCIMDGQQRVATLNLQVGEARSIYGLSPFRVYSADLNVIKVYFQGQLIKLNAQEITQIKLTPSTYTALKN